MSCCISSAVCCVLITSSMSGVALGYNYSLAEYIDLKETNVSVYLKRGVFDDEVADDMDWRRSGHLPIAGHVRDDNLKTGAPEDEESTTLPSGRRLDDSIFESDSNNKYEGSLMKLTAKAPVSSTNTEEVTGDMEISEIASKYPSGSLDQLKAIQSVINMRKMADARGTTAKGVLRSTYPHDERYLPHFPEFPDKMDPSRRRMWQYGPGLDIIPSNSARLAVPDSGIKEKGNWMFPKHPEVYKANFPEMSDYGWSPTYPSPVTPKASPVRPTRVKTPKPTYMIQTKRVTLQKMETQKSIDRDLDIFKDKLILDKYDAPGIKSDPFSKKQKGNSDKSDTEDYEDEVKGLPVRKKRNIIVYNKLNKVPLKTTITTGKYSSIILQQNPITLPITGTVSLKLQQRNENDREIKNYPSSLQTFVSKLRVSSKDIEVTVDSSLSNEKVTLEPVTDVSGDLSLSINDNKPLKLVS